MSADFINGIGSRSSGLREAYGPGSRQTPPATSGGDGAGTVAAGPSAAPEGFTPTPEAGESKQDTQAGEARASQIFAAWGASSPPPAASAGQLDIQGGDNTAVNQVHSVQNGQHASSQGPDAGFTGGTVFSPKPPAA
jgi:hypothetical protein